MTTKLKPILMRPEYDFTGGIRGKYAKALRENGYTIRVYKADGSFMERRVAGERMVTLAPDVQKYFPDSKAVNHALRTLVPQKRQSGATKGHSIRNKRKASMKTHSKA